MLHRDNLRTLVGPALPFALEARRSFTTQCPECGPTRQKSSAKSLSVYRDDDGMVRYVCHHPGCELNKWSQRPDPNPQGVDKTEELAIAMPVPAYETIPTDYMGNKLYWYRDLEGQYLFASQRIDTGSAKFYVPFIYTETGFVTGKNARWPINFKGLFGAETIKGKTKAIVVEGEKAALAAQALFPTAAVVSWFGGANRGYDTADWSVLRDIDTVLLWPDNDEPGIKAMRAIARLVPSKKVMIAKTAHLPPKADLADNLSKEDIKKAIDEATEVGTKLTGIVSLDDIDAQLDSLSAFRHSGFEVIDAHTKLPGSGLVVIEGRTKHGKSALAVALTSAMLRQKLEQTVVYYSYEMTAAKVYLRYIKTLAPGLDVTNFRGTDAADTISNLIHDSHLNIVDQSSQLTIADIVLAASKPQLRGGVIVIDYLQIVPMATSFGRNSRQLMLKEMLDELRVAAHKNNVLVMVLSQLTPDYANPQNDSPREAKDIHYSADLVLRVWNKGVGEAHPTYNNVAGTYIIHTYLNRDGESNVLFEGNLESGAKLSIKRRVRNSK